MVKHILLATDGSPCAVRAAAEAAHLANRLDAKLTLLFVQSPLSEALGFSGVPASEDLVAIEQEDAAQAYESVIAKTRPPIDAMAVVFDCYKAVGPAGDTIVGVAAQTDADLIVVGHRGLNALQSFLLGSTSERVVHTARCSVLVVR